MELLTKPAPADLDAADATASLVVAPAAGPRGRLVTLLSRGCFVRITTGSTVRELLLRQLHIDPAYVEKEIKIVFLDGSPVDELDAAVVRDGATLALSGAMPGLVGAAMRRDGPSWMRQAITHREAGGARPVFPGVVFLKLFNQVMEDLGARFLVAGVYVETAALAAFLRRFDEGFWRECPMTLNGVAVGPAALASAPAWLRLSVAAPAEGRCACS